MGKSYRDLFQKQSGTIGNCLVKTTAWVSNQPKQSCVKSSLFGQIHHVALWFNHHSYPVCQLRLQPLEIPWWAPLSELHWLVCTRPVPRCGLRLSTSCDLSSSQQMPRICFSSLHKVRYLILSWKGAGRSSSCTPSFLYLRNLKLASLGSGRIKI